MCQFPQNEAATSAALARARLIMQLMAAGLILVSLFAILAQQFFFVIYALLLAYVLYLGWAKFDTTSTLCFFLLCCWEVLMSFVWLIEMVQYFGDIKDRDVLGILLGVSKFAYFTNSLCFSHFCYKVFKAYSTNQIGGDYELMPISNPNLSNLAASQTERSRAMKEEIRRDLAFRPFQGTGVALG